MHFEIKKTVEIAIEIMIFALIIGVLASYIRVGNTYRVVNMQETTRAASMRENKEMMNYSMLEYLTKDDVVTFAAKFRREIDIEIKQAGKIYKLDKLETDSIWDIEPLIEFLSGANISKYDIELETQPGDSMVVLGAKITVRE